MSSTLRILAALACALANASAMACGYCIEDRVAAVYDRSVVDGALARKHHAAFLGIEGGIVDAEVVRAARVALEGVRGVDKRGMRTRAENAAIAVTFDPAVVSVDRLVSAANKALARRGIALAALRVIDESGRLREP